MQENNYFAYVNGVTSSYDKASLSIGDRGLKFGDGVYETIRVTNGKPFAFEKHMERLQTSLGLLKIGADITGLYDVCIGLIKRNNIKDGTVRLMITRGVGGVGYMPSSGNEFGIVVEALPLPELSENPINLWVSQWKKIPPACLPAAAKTMQGLSSTLARMEAAENNCFEAVLLSLEGNICECSSSNIFWAKDGKLYTPSLDVGILAGTTRDSIIEYWPDKVIEGVFKLENLLAADEVFVTNVVWTALPVKKLMPANKEFTKYDFCAKAKDIIINAMKG